MHQIGSCQLVTTQRAAVLLGSKSSERSPCRNSNPRILAYRELEALAKDGKLGCHAAFNNQEGMDGLPTKACAGEAVEELPTKAAKTAKQPTAAGLRHIATEQRRRDRINEGCVTASVLSLLCAPLISHYSKNAGQESKAAFRRTELSTCNSATTGEGKYPDSTTVSDLNGTN